MPDDHSKLVPLLPIPNRTVKRLCANDSADPRVKVGHRQAPIPAQKRPALIQCGALLLGGAEINLATLCGESLSIAQISNAAPSTKTLSSFGAKGVQGSLSVSSAVTTTATRSDGVVC